MWSSSTPRRSRPGLKAEQKLYHHYTGYPGGLRTEEFRKRFARKPEVILEQAVLRMLPKTKLGRQMISKLKIYRGDQAPSPGAEAGSKGARSKGVKCGCRARRHKI